MIPGVLTTVLRIDKIALLFGQSLLVYGHKAESVKMLSARFK